MTAPHTSAGLEMNTLHLEFQDRAAQILRDAAAPGADTLSRHEVLVRLIQHTGASHALCMALCDQLYPQAPHAKWELRALIQEVSTRTEMSINPERGNAP